MISAEVFRTAAAAALTNASELCAEAELLINNGHDSRAAALAVIGLEEFAKAAACTVAAVFPEQSNDLWNRLSDHNVKQSIADIFEGVECQDEYRIDVISWQSGGSSSVRAEDDLLEIFKALAKSSWGSFIPTRNSAYTTAKKNQTWLNDPNMHARPSKCISTAFIKNAAFYVDIKKGDVLTPERIDAYARAEIIGLAWRLRHSVTLRELLSNEEKWEWFAKEIRQTPGTGLCIEAEILTPRKTAIKKLQRLPEPATWDQIKKEIERGAQGATEE